MSLTKSYLCDATYIPSDHALPNYVHNVDYVSTSNQRPAPVLFYFLTEPFLDQSMHVNQRPGPTRLSTEGFQGYPRRSDLRIVKDWLGSSWVQIGL